MGYAGARRAQAAVPERSLEQQMNALQRANEIRVGKARVKRDLKAGRADMTRLLLDPPDCIKTAKAFEMLMALPKVGRVKANKILQVCRISPSKSIEGLSERQRAELISMVRR